MEDFIKQFNQILESVASVTITSHLSPDDDSIGSVLALYGFLKKSFPKIQLNVLYSSKRADRYASFANFDKIKFVDDIADGPVGDLLIILDGGQFSRVTRKPDVLKNKIKKTICIDHHASPPDKFDLAFIDTQATSVVDVLYRLFLGQETDPAILEPVLLGILGDTGTFQYLNHRQIYVYDIAKRIQGLLQVSVPSFKSRYEFKEKKTLEILGEFMRNTQYLRVKGWPDFTLSFVTRDVFAKYECDDLDVSEASHLYMAEYTRTIKGYPWGIVVSPKKDGRCGFSVRSLPGSVSARDIGEKTGKGGGHDRAGGGSFDPVGGAPVSHQEVIDYLLDWMGKNKPLLAP